MHTDHDNYYPSKWGIRMCHDKQRNKFLDIEFLV